MSRVIAITGPTGSGKSTIGEALAKSLGKCVNIDADHIKHMIVNGFVKDDTNAGGWNFTEWALVGQNIGLLAKNFTEKGFDVVINGYIDEPAWTEIQQLVTIDHKFLLLPNPEINKLRDASRTEDIRMGDASVDEHQDHFKTEPIYKDFRILDTSKETIEETLTNLMSIIKV